LPCLNKKGMPNTTSAKKALRQSKSRNTRNKTVKAAYKKVLKDIRKVAPKDTAAATAKINTLYKTLDKAAKVGVIKKNKASRLKARVSAQLTAKSNKASS
jgi:small subunit ribosomal protein S20